MLEKSNVTLKMGPYLVTSKELSQLKKNNDSIRRLLGFIAAGFDPSAQGILEHINESLFRTQCLLTKIETIK